MERLIFSVDRDTAVTLAKGPRRERGNFAQPGVLGGTTVQHVPAKWASKPSRNAHKSEIIGVKYSQSCITLSSSPQCDWNNSRSWWRVDLGNWEPLHSSSVFVFRGQNNHVDQIRLLSVTRMRISLGVFIYRQIIHSATPDPEWQTNCSFRDESDCTPCSAKLQRDFHYTLIPAIWKVSTHISSGANVRWGNA